MVNSPQFVAPHPGSPDMPRWTTENLVEAPYFRWRNWMAMIGPGLVMGASAIGGGEWLAGPAVTAMYGPALLWVATVSILVQVLYNIEISRYTLYSGEPIFTGKFRVPPGPAIWLWFYLLLDWGSIFPYLIVNAAVTVEAMFIAGFEPSGKHWLLHKCVSTGLFLSCAIPLIVGGKIYNSLKVVMSAKLVIVFGFLIMIALLFSRPAQWLEIAGGFVQFGNFPVSLDEDRNGNGQLDPGEDFDRDGHLDVRELLLPKSIDTDGDGVFDTWPKGEDGKLLSFEDIDEDGKRDGANVENMFVTLIQEGRWPKVDLSLIAFIAGLAAIAGNGGLTNTPISNFTRDQGWGMGYHVGAIPSMVGGHGIALSHVGCVFEVNAESIPRWKRWYQHIVRDQVFVWMAACFLGVALPSFLSIGFLPRGTEVDRSKVASMTSGGVARAVLAPQAGTLAETPAFQSWMNSANVAETFRMATLFCGFLVLMTSMVSTIDGFVRRWVDVFWTANAKLRKLDVSYIKYVYFTVLVSYCVFGIAVIWITDKPGRVFEIATMGYNFALAFSCLHTVRVNTLLLPVPLRPHWLIRLGLILGALFFSFLGTMAVLGLFGFV